MQLNKLMSWGRDAPNRSEDEDSNKLKIDDGESNVSHINLENPLDNPVGLVGLRNSDKPEAKGLMCTFPLDQFFSQNFVSQGRYTGSLQKSRDALEQGLEGIIAQFQNMICMAMHEQQAKIDSLKRIEIQTEGVSVNSSDQLKFVCTSLEKKLFTLKEQSDLSGHRKGWVLAALNEYRIGFDRGLRESIDAELLGL